MNTNNKFVYAENSVDNRIGSCVSAYASTSASDAQLRRRYAYSPPTIAGGERNALSEVATLHESISRKEVGALDDCTIMTTVSPTGATSSSELSNTTELSDELLQPLPSNIVVGTAATDGIGLSTSLALLARHMSDAGYRVALIDADLAHGGLDVLLGLEDDEGRRLQEVEAPLGRCDGYVLSNELIHWSGVDVLAFAPWQGVKPDPWVVEAAIRALAEVYDVVVVDIGAGDSAKQMYQAIPQLVRAATVAAVELSVLDLARFRAYMKTLRDTYGSDVFAGAFTMLGLAPRGLTQRAYVLDVDEAAQYLSTSLLGAIPHVSRLYTDMIGGYGIRNVPSSMESIIKQLERWLLENVMSYAGNSSARYGRSQYNGRTQYNGRSQYRRTSKTGAQAHARRSQRNTSQYRGGKYA